MCGGEIFKLIEHTERLFKAAEIPDFQIACTVAEIDEACKATAAKNGLTDGYVRPIAWRSGEMISIASKRPLPWGEGGAQAKLGRVRGF